MWVYINQLKALREKNLTFPEKEGILPRWTGVAMSICLWVSSLLPELQGLDLPVFKIM